MERIDDLLRLWQTNKAQIQELEKKNDLYRSYAEKLMNKNGTDDIEGSTYRVTRSNVVRESVNKKDLPSDVWNRYCKKSSFFSYYIKEKKKS